MGTITAGNITANTITSGTLNVDRLSAGSIVESKLGTGAVTSGKIGSGAVITGKMATYFVATYLQASTISLGISSTYNGIHVAGGSQIRYVTSPVTNAADIVRNSTYDLGTPSSDRRLKRDIKPLREELKKIMKLNPVSFIWKKEGTPALGMIAQEVLDIYPDFVIHDKKKDIYGLSYSKFITPLVAAVQEQQVQIDELRKEINLLRGEDG